MKTDIKNIIWTYAFLFIATVYISGLFIDLTGDGGLYAAITRQMVESGDWFHLKINGEPYDQKPHLLFWLAGIGVQLFGNTNFAFKLFPVLYGWLGFYFTYRMGKTLFTEETGKLAALFTATSQVFFLYSFDIHTDIVLQTGVALALWQLAAYLQHKKPVHFIFGFVGVGLAMLAKGPVGAVIPFFAVVIFLLVKRDFKQLLHPKWTLGIVIVLVVISPTIVHLYQNFGRQGIQFYFITNNFGRITGDYAGSSNDPFFYLYNSIWIFLPWTLFVFGAVYSEIKSWFSGVKRNPHGIYLLGGVLIYVLIISIAKGKAPNYFLIAVPPVMVLTAKWLNVWRRVFSGKRQVLFGMQWIFLSLLAALLFFVVVIYRGNSLLWFGLSLFCSAIAVLGAMKNFSRFFNKIAYASIIFIGLFNFFINTEIVPSLAKYQGARQALAIFERYSRPGDKLYNFALEEYELFFMAEQRVEDIKVPQKIYNLLDTNKTWVYTNEIKYNDIIKMENKIDTVFIIRHRGMNELNFKFLNPENREESLKRNYLIKGKMNQ
ncbi:MAG: ArnT family glycosyltransferase [Prolixibacteraceae bacterium]